jgi:hypothetical protein
VGEGTDTRETEGFRGPGPTGAALCFATMWLEALGYLASILVAVSLMMTSILRLRIVNLVGSACFTLYGALIGAWPVAAVNFAITLINVWHLLQIARAQEYFHLLEVQPSSEYLAEFLRFHRADIERFLPGFDPRPAEGQTAFFVLRDMVPAGLLLAEPRGADGLMVRADFVIPGYRDFKIGDFIFRRNAEAFTKRGVRTVWSLPGSRAHETYLRRLGFRRESAASGEPLYRREIG